MQLFFVLEGLSLWKVPAPSAKTITDLDDDDKVCAKILAGSGSPSERSRRSNEFLEASRKYKFWRRPTILVCSFAPLISFALLTLALSVVWSVEDGACCLWLNIGAFLYFLLKSLIVLRTKYCANRYDETLKEAVPINDRVKPPVLQALVVPDGAKE